MLMEEVSALLVQAAAVRQVHRRGLGPRRAAGVNLEYSPCLRYATECISSKHRASASALVTQWRSSAMRGGAYSAVQRGRRVRARKARGVQG